MWVGIWDESANGSSYILRQFGYDGERFGAGNRKRRVVGFQMPRDCLRMFRFIERRMVEADREGFDRPSRGFLHQRYNARRIVAAGQKRP